VNDMTTKKPEGRPEYDFRGGVRGKHAGMTEPVRRPAGIDSPKSAPARSGSVKAPAKAKS